MPSAALATHAELTPHDQAQVLALVADAAASDGVRPLSERFRLGLADAAPQAPHLLAHCGVGELTAYGRVLADGQAELVVAPAHRRRGIGTALVSALAYGGARGIWAHGNLPAARALGQATGWSFGRILYKLGRPVAAGDALSPPLPAGYRLRGFRPGEESSWLAVNGRAFARHPEQGAVTRADLDRLLAQDWFDPEGLLLLIEEGTGEVVGSHWTKVDPAERGPGPDGIPVPAGEVYVVALDPRVHGRGLAGPLTQAGIAHLARRGLGSVVLYVDADNEPALRTYQRVGFTELEAHAQYQRDPGAP